MLSAEPSRYASHFHHVQSSRLSLVSVSWDFLLGLVTASLRIRYSPIILPNISLGSKLYHR